MTKVRVNWGPAPEPCAVRLFSVYNTSHKELLVLARNAETALSIAGTANHVYGLGSSRKDSNYPHAAEIRTPFGRLIGYWTCIQHAVSRRLEGTLHLQDGLVAVGDEVIEA